MRYLQHHCSSSRDVVAGLQSINKMIEKLQAASSDQSDLISRVITSTDKLTEHVNTKRKVVVNPVVRPSTPVAVIAVDVKKPSLPETSSSGSTSSSSTSSSTPVAVVIDTNSSGSGLASGDISAIEQDDLVTDSSVASSGTEEPSDADPSAG